MTPHLLVNATEGYYTDIPDSRAPDILYAKKNTAEQNSDHLRTHRERYMGEST